MSFYNLSSTRTIQRRPVLNDDSSPEFEGIHPTLSQIYLNRNIASVDELDHSLARLHSPDLLKGMENAIDLLEEAIVAEAMILIVGDFDADGATSTALGMLALRALGATNVNYIIPNRFEFGYGLTPEIVTVANELQPDLIITVDNGISSHAGVQLAHDLGISVLVTDHHLPGESLPDADAIVNPNQPDDRFPSKTLAGVGVLFYLLLALRSRLRKQNWFSEQNITEPNMADFLDLVALGTVADLVPLDQNNRILVYQGLQRIRRQRCRPGIRALLDIAGKDPSQVVSSDLGFMVGPRLNAAGRLDDISCGVECLISEDLHTARQLAGQLDALNKERRQIESSMQGDALAAIKEIKFEKQSAPKGICLFDESWHQGIIGLVASRIREHTDRPVVAFAPVDDVELKGSARSIPGINMRDALEAISVRCSDLLGKFGGHAMAAGLTLPRKNLERFSDEFNQEIDRLTNSELNIGVILSDGQLGDDELTVEFADLLRNAGPWGQGFPEPIFDDEFEILDQRVVGDTHLKMKLQTKGRKVPVDAIAFRYLKPGESFTPMTNIRAAFRLDVNEFRGTRNSQLIVEYMEPLSR